MVSMEGEVDLSLGQTIPDICPANSSSGGQLSFGISLGENVLRPFLEMAIEKRNLRGRLMEYVGI